MPPTPTGCSSAAPRWASSSWSSRPPSPQGLCGNTKAAWSCWSMKVTAAIYATPDPGPGQRIPARDLAVPVNDAGFLRCELAGTMAECVGYVSLTPSINHGESGFVSEPDVVFAAFD